MKVPLMTSVAVGSAGVLLTLFAGGIASAQPNVESIVNSTCTYPQVIAALNAQSPDVASQVSANPVATAWLQQLVAAPPVQRREMIVQAQSVPAIQEYSGLISQVANSCSNY